MPSGVKVPGVESLVELPPLYPFATLADKAGAAAILRKAKANLCDGERVVAAEIWICSAVLAADSSALADDIRDCISCALGRRAYLSGYAFEDRPSTFAERQRVRHFWLDQIIRYLEAAQ